MNDRRGASSRWCGALPTTLAVACRRYFVTYGPTPLLYARFILSIEGTRSERSSYEGGQL
jgi:hypothetical protein